MHHGKHSPAQCKIPCHSHFAYTQNKMTCKATNTTNMHDIATGKSWHCHISANMQQSCQAHLFPSLNIQQFQTLLTLFSKSFSYFPHGTCLLSVSYTYVAADEIYHQLCAPIPRNVTQWKAPCTTTCTWHTGLSPSSKFFFKKFSCTPWLVTHLQRTIQGWWPQFPCWACSCSFAITCKILFGFWSSTYLYA